MTWWGVLPVVAAQSTLVVGPGWLTLRLAGVRGPRALAGAAPVTLGFLGIAGITLQALGVRWSWWAVAAALLPVLVVAAGLGRWVRTEVRCAGVRGLHPGGLWAHDRLPRPGLVGLALLAAGLALAIPVATGMGHPDALLQQWDAVFHLNGAQLVRDTGDDSLFGAMRPMFGIAAAHVYYPSIWHGVVALSPGSVPLAANASTFTFGVVVWLLGLAGLGRVLGGRTWSVTVWTVLIGGAFVAFPTGLMSERAQWPLGAAIAALPGTLALLVGAVRTLPGEARLLTPARATVSTVVLLAAAGGVGMTHASAFFSLLLVAAPFATGRAWGLVGRWWRDGHRKRTIAIAVSLALVIVLVTVWTVTNPRVQSMIAYRRDTRTPVPVSVASLLLDLPTTTGFPQVLALWPITICVLVGAWTIRRDRGRRWSLWSALLVVAMVALADGPPSPLQPIAGLWYTQAARIAAVFPVVAGPLGAYGLLRIAGAARTSPPLRRLLQALRLHDRPVEAVATALIAVMFVVTAGWNAPTKHHFFASSYVPGHTRWGHMLSTDEITLLHRLPRTTPPDAVILGDPANGAAFAYAVAHRHVALPQLTVSSATPDQRLLLEHFDELTSNPAVCAALRRLGVTHFYQDTAGPADGAKTTPDAPGLQQPMTSGLETVDHAGTATLYRVTACRA